MGSCSGMGFSATSSSETLLVCHSERSEESLRFTLPIRLQGSFDSASDLLCGSLSPLRMTTSKCKPSNVEPRCNPHVLDMPQQAQSHLQRQGNHSEPQKRHQRKLQQAHALKIFCHSSAEERIHKASTD